jgi:hypothetical protein
MSASGSAKRSAHRIGFHQPQLQPLPAANAVSLSSPAASGSLLDSGKYSVPERRHRHQPVAAQPFHGAKKPNGCTPVIGSRPDRRRAPTGSRDVASIVTRSASIARRSILADRVPRAPSPRTRVGQPPLAQPERAHHPAMDDEVGI